ncbi:MAG TPA: hypothetical protein VJ986_06450 [Gaiellaceae bacterium]|nr:hypothetical protein [Gaiellaceae bacterium]
MLAPVVVALAVAASSWGLAPDTGTRIADGVSTEAVSSGGVVHAWVTSAGGMSTFESTNGLTFTPFEDALTPPGADAAVVPIARGGWRMYFTQQTPTGKVIGSAVSGDLLNWTVEPGVRLDLGTSKATGVPEAVALPDGRVRLYYVASGGRAETIDSAISTDGLTFAPEKGDRLTGGYVDPAVVRLANGSWLMVCSTSPSSKQRLFTATSPDGLTWTVAAKPVLDSKSANVLDPTLVPLGGDRFRVYFSVAPIGKQLTGPYRVESGVLSHSAAKEPVKKPAKKHKKPKHKKKP